MKNFCSYVDIICWYGTEIENLGKKHLSYNDLVKEIELLDKQRDEYISQLHKTISGIKKYKSSEYKVDSYKVKKYKLF